MKPVIVTALDTTRRVIESIETLLEGSRDLLDEKGRMLDEKGRVLDEEGRMLDEEGRMLREDGPVLEGRGTRLRDDGAPLESIGRKIENPVRMSDGECRLTRRNGGFPSGNAGGRLAVPGCSTLPAVCGPKRPFAYSICASVSAPGLAAVAACASTLGRRVCFPHQAPGEDTRFAGSPKTRTPSNRRSRAES